MKFSIIICTRNRDHAIMACLDSVAQAFAAAMPVEAEIVVVDNASTDDTSAVVKKWAEGCAFPVRLLHEPKKGLSAARNCGLRGATGELIAFTDDDCRLSKNYIADALRYDSADTGLVLRGGRVDLGDPADLPITVKTDDNIIRWQLETHPVGDKWLGDNILGCNMTMRRALADRIGFFDERLGAGAPVPSGEDSDYIFRTYLAGLMIEYVPDMGVFHHHGRREKSEARKLFDNYAMGAGAMYAKYVFKAPKLCRQLYWDARKAVKEIFSDRNDFMPDIGFGHMDWVAGCVRGIMKYGLISVKTLKG